MRVIKFLFWTSLAVGLGIFLASFPIGGRTPLEHAERAWKHEAPQRLEALRGDVGDVYERAKAAVGAETKIRERHLKEDRDEVNRLVSRRSAGK